MNKKRIGILVAVIAAVLLVATGYFYHTNMPVLQPEGPIAQKERNLIVFALLLSLVVVIPVFTMAITFAWKYRETNQKARYSPEFDHSRIAETIWWLVPGLLILILSIVTWNSSHSLDPYKPIASNAPPLTIQVVALDWKWLFIYPEQHVASVNMVAFPVHTPINLEITSDAPMNSFWIPALSGQIYAMPGMSTQLHLEATKPGNFYGSSANISGAGFAGMTFTARADSAADFAHWITAVGHSYVSLDASTYAALSRPSHDDPVRYYSSVENGLYATIVTKYMTPQNGGMQAMVRSQGMGMTQ